MQASQLSLLWVSILILSILLQIRIKNYLNSPTVRLSLHYNIVYAQSIITVEIYNVFSTNTLWLYRGNMCYHDNIMATNKHYRYLTKDDSTLHWRHCSECTI